MVRGHDKKEKRIIKLKNKTMPKFEKSTGYQLRQGNSPNKFVNRFSFLTKLCISNKPN